MKPVLIAWASRNGSTESLAQRAFEVLSGQGIPVELTAVRVVDWDRLGSWSALVLGSPTYGMGDLHPDWDKPERLLRDSDLAGIPAAVFGCGSPRYVTPWWAVDILANRLKNQGARLMAPPLKMDTTTALRVRDADGWIETLAASLKEAAGP